jgi:hypothetical protein
MAVGDILRSSFLTACSAWSCFKFALSPNNAFTPATTLNLQ